MSINEIIEWLEENHEDEDYDLIANTMLEIYEEEDEIEMSFQELYDSAIERINDDGGIWPNGRSN